MPSDGITLKVIYYFNNHFLHFENFDEETIFAYAREVIHIKVVEMIFENPMYHGFLTSSAKFALDFNSLLD